MREPRILAASGTEQIWQFLQIEGPFGGCPYNKNPTIWGPYKGPIFCKLPYGRSPAVSPGDALPLIYGTISGFQDWP